MSGDVDRVSPVGSETPIPLGAGYTVPCRTCGTRLTVTEEELAASLDRRPVCWPCSQRDADDLEGTG